MPHQQLGFNLLHRIERNADHDEQRGAAKPESLHAGCPLQQAREHRDQRQEDGTKPGDAVEHLGDVVRGGLAWADARDEPAVLADVVASSMGLNTNTV